MLFGLRKLFFSSVATVNAVKLSSPQHAINAAVSAKPAKSKQTSAHLLIIIEIAYFVERTELGKNLPVYTDVRRNGQRIFTIIRRIYGNIQVLSKVIFLESSNLLVVEGRLGVGAAQEGRHRGQARLDANSH